MKLVVFDMDGVIFKGANFWLELHHHMGTQAEALELWSLYGKEDYNRLSELTASLWKNQSSDKYWHLIETRKYTPGVSDVVSFLKRKGIKISIVTSGPYDLAARAAREMEFDIVRGNRLGFDYAGRFDGTVDVQVNDNRKEESLAEVQHLLKIDPQDTIIIGDTINDAYMGRIAEESIGFRVRDRSARRCFNHHIDGNSLAPAVNLLSAL